MEVPSRYTDGSTIQDETRRTRGGERRTSKRNFMVYKKNKT
jgi:hypothetical protein